IVAKGGSNTCVKRGAQRGNQILDRDLPLIGNPSLVRIEHVCVGLVRFNYRRWYDRDDCRWLYPYWVGRDPSVTPTYLSAQQRSRLASSICELFQQRSRLLQVFCVKSLGESAVDFY